MPPTPDTRYIVPGFRGKPLVAYGHFNPHPAPGTRERALRELARIYMPVLREIMGESNAGQQRSIRLAETEMAGAVDKGGDRC